MKANEINEIIEKIDEWKNEQTINAEIIGIEQLESCIEIKIQIKGTIIKSDLERLTKKLDSSYFFIYTIKEKLVIDVMIDNPEKEIPF